MWWSLGWASSRGTAEASGEGAALVLSVVDSRTRMVHLVGVETAALHRRFGRYPALCDMEVISVDRGRACRARRFRG